MTSALNGVLIVNKSAGWTSHDVVAKTRGLLQEKQIGHLGTLDPLATGVLPLALGNATRLIEFASYPKEYVTTCLLGKTTDTCDVTGTLLAEKPTIGLSEEDLRKAILQLGNLTEQVPPMVSALKKDGQKLYELARKGVEVERKPRPIRIEAVEILNIAVPRVTFRAACSAGTYVRVLCQTLGEGLGVGGCMESLERTRVGPFSLKEALALEEVKKRVEEGDLSGMLLPASRLVDHLPQANVEKRLLEGLCQGQAIRVEEGHPGLYRVLNDQGCLSAVAEVVGGLLRPKKVFGVEGID